MSRNAQIERTTGETQITAALDLDGGAVDISTGIGFFDHMLHAFAVHGGFGLILRAIGDLHVDAHHTVEDTGIVLGQAFAKALSDKGGIERYGSYFIPMDESLAFAGVDVSGRPFLVFDAAFGYTSVGEYDCCLTEEFFRAFAFNAGITLHAKALYGKNDHHKIEALFKALAHAMQIAVRKKDGGILSTKGTL